MAGFYNCMDCGNANIPLDSDDLVCVFCLAAQASKKPRSAQDIAVDALLDSVFPDGVQ